MNNLFHPRYGAMVNESNYTDRQAQHDREYEQAWEDAPQSFKDKAHAMGLDVAPEVRESMVLPFDPEYDARETKYDGDYQSGAYTPDMATLLDTHVDAVIEKYGVENAGLIRAVAAELKKPMEDELIRNRSLLLGRVSCYLISDQKGNVLARIHALLHSIPRLAGAAGYSSMRASAKECHVSPEWLRRTRDKWCQLLGIEIPSEGRKSPEACAKYKENGFNNHWRKQTYKTA